MTNLSVTFSLKNGGSLTEHFSDLIAFDCYCEDNSHLFVSFNFN